MFRLQQRRNSYSQQPHPELRPRNATPEKIFLFTNARDEPSIVEWAFHHLLLGFTHVFIYDHKSIEPIREMFLAHVAINPQNQHLIDRITVARLNSDPTSGSNFNETPYTNIKIPLMNSALEYSVNQNADWLLYLDADEFLTLKLDSFKELNPLKQFLSMFYFADSLAINWLMFGSSDHETQDKDVLLTNTFIYSDRKLNPHVKTFVRPAYAYKTTNPHWFPVMNSNRCFAATGNVMEHKSAFNTVEMEFQNTPAYIAHYVVQSKQEFLRRKGRPMDDGTGDKSKMYHADLLHTVHNECLNEQLKERHGQELNKLFARVPPKIDKQEITYTDMTYFT